MPALCKLHWWVTRTWHLERAHGLPRTRYWYSADRNPSERPWIPQRVAWRARAHRIAALPFTPWPRWWLPEALCIHQHEGAWNDNPWNTASVYYGGMQFLLGTWAAHGGLRFGPRPDLASPRDQLTVAYWTWRDDGGSWREWGTASACGLT